MLKPFQKTVCALGFWETSLIEECLFRYNCTGRTYAYGRPGSHDSSILPVRATSLRKRQNQSWPNWEVLLTLLGDRDIAEASR